MPAACGDPAAAAADEVRRRTRIALTGVSKRFGSGATAVQALESVDLAVAAGRVRLADRPVGLRQVDAAAHHRRPHRADGRARWWSTASRRGSARLDQDYGIAFQQAGLLEWRTVQGNVELPLAAARAGQGGAPRAGAGAARARRPRRLRRPPPEPALRRHAAARRDRAGARAPARAAAHGRAVRRAGRDDARAHAGRADPDLRRDRAPRSCSSPTRSPRRCSSRSASS